MHISGIITSDVANGIGVRLSIFVSGCKNHCPGCFQPETWDFNYGELYDQEVHDYILEELKKVQYDGITFLGGDPFELESQKEVRDLILDIKDSMGSNRNIWMYTGYTYDEDLMENGKRYIAGVTNDILNNIDVLVDGRFIEEKRDVRLAFRGSTNQRVINVVASRKKKEIVLLDL